MRASGLDTVLYVLNVVFLYCTNLIPHHQPHCLKCSKAQELHTVRTSSSCLPKTHKTKNKDTTVIKIHKCNSVFLPLIMS